MGTASEILAHQLRRLEQVRTTAGETNPVPAARDGWSAVLVDVPEGSACRCTLLACEQLFDDLWTCLNPLVSRFSGAQLPAEILSGAAEDEAAQIATALVAAGADCRAVRSCNVAQVRHRPEDLWPHRVVQDYRFTDVSSHILSLPPIAARRSLAELQAANPGTPAWAVEAFCNHNHPCPHGLPPRDEMRCTRALARELADALYLAYPERAFVVCNHLGENYLTFYQQWPDAKIEPGPPKRGAPEWWIPTAMAWCTTCEGPHSYQKSGGPEAEFPDVEWGECSECGTEVCIVSPEELLLVGPNWKGKARVPDEGSVATAGGPRMRMVDRIML